MFWKKNKVAPVIEREWKQLLRENLDTVAIDLFHSDDPLLALNPEERKIYLKKFKDLVDDPDLMSRIKYLVNLQARLTLKSVKDGAEPSIAGAMNINGICLVKEDFERLSQMFDKETVPGEKFNRFDVI